ncbi:MAG TPA: nucleotide sugar dehydrogenase, partial [Planctomycetota bacterium]
MSRRIAVLGLGYVGLPLAEGFARAHGGAIGFDSDAEHVARLRAGAGSSGVDFTADPARLAGADFFVVAVPTPIDADRRPDLGPLRSAAERIGAALRPGGVVVFESTVYPGVTEDECAPILERRSGLVRGRGFGLGYSPERINPGDAEHTLEDVVKVVAALDEDSWRAIEAVYAPVARAGLYRAPSIRIAEAAKVLENTQRDLNIALMNELAMVCERLGLDTRAVLETAGTKWNFLPFEPGLVGGHCVGVDPYWLTAAAEAAGHHPEVILAGRRINDGMGRWVGARVLEQLALGEP